MGDRPHRVLTAVETARAKTKMAKLPPPPTPVTPKAGPVQQASYTPGAAPKSSTTEPLWPTKGPNLAASLTPEAMKTKELAKTLVAQGRTLQKTNKLVEARAKFLEAQKLHATFGTDDDKPELALAQVAVEGQKQIAAMTAESDSLRTRDSISARAQLNSAKQLALGLGLDTNPIRFADAIAECQRSRSRAGPQVDSPGSGASRFGRGCEDVAENGTGSGHARQGSARTASR